MNRAINIEDLRRLAKKRLPRVIYDYIEGGSFEQITLRANRTDLDAIRFKQRLLIDVSKRSLETEVLGEKLSMPIILGPVGSLGSFSRRGEVQAARAAERLGIQSCLSTGSICSIEEVREARQKPFWFQLYINQNRAHAEALIGRAARADCPVLQSLHAHKLGGVARLVGDPKDFLGLNGCGAGRRPPAAAVGIEIMY